MKAWLYGYGSFILTLAAHLGIQVFFAVTTQFEVLLFDGSY